MPDDLHISSSMDASPIVEGMGQAASAASSAGAQINAAASGVQEMNIAVEEGIKLNKTLAGVIDFFNNKAALAAATSTEVASAFTVLTQQASKLQLELVKTAGGFELVSAASVATIPKAVGEISNLSSAIGYGTTRLAAMELGVGRMGYELGILARAFPAVSAAMSYLLIPVGIIAGIQIISTFSDKIEAMGQEIRKSSREFEDSASSTVHHADALILDNLKLDDQIAKLEGRPTHNRLAEALLESRMKADDLVKSLGDATEKAVELLRTGEVGIWKSIITGAATTTDLKEALNGPLELLAVAQAKQNEMYISGTENQKRAADDEVQIARNKVLEILEVQARLTEAQKKQSLETVTKLSQNKNAVIPGLDNPKEKVDLEYAPREQAIASLIAMLKAQAGAEELAAQAGKKRSQEANVATKSDLDKRDYTIEEDKVKNAERAAQQEVQIADKAALDKFKATDAGIKLEIAKAEEGGQIRVVAELASFEKLKTSQQQLTKDKLENLDKEYASEKAALTREKTLIEQYKPGDEKVKALADNAAAMERLELNTAAKRNSINSESETALTNLETEQTNKRIANATREANEKTQSALASVRRRLDDARNESSEAIALQRETTAANLAEVSRLESAHLISARTAMNMRLSLLGQEKIAIDGIIQAEIKAMEAQRSFIQSQMTGLPAASAALKELKKAYEDISIAIDHAHSNQTKLDNQITTQSTAAIKKYKDTWLDGLKQIGSQIKSSIGSNLAQMATMQESFAQGMQNIWRSMIASIVQGITEMAIESLVQFIGMKLGMIGATKTAATANITASAAEGAAAAGASVAAIPVVGWSMVPEVSAATYGMLMAYLPFAFAERGGVMAGDGPLFAHKDEMILPASLSATMQKMALGYQNGGSTSAIHVHPTLNVYAIDGASVKKMADQYGDILGDAAVKHIKRKVKFNSL